MRRSASEIINDLETRIARLERQATSNRQAMYYPNITPYIAKEILDTLETRYDEEDFEAGDIELVNRGVSDADGNEYGLFTVSGFYHGIIRNDGRLQELDFITDEKRKAEKLFKNKLGR